VAVSTLLKLIYGVHDLHEGHIFWNETSVRTKYNLVPGMPFIKYLSQDFDLMPYTTVAENVGKFYPMFPEQKRTHKRIIKIVEMTEFADVKRSI
jgi:ABC-type nitrate/sulfonate/bicarbonate transport system ATPase subunit